MPAGSPGHQIAQLFGYGTEGTEPAVFWWSLKRSQAGLCARISHQGALD